MSKKTTKQIVNRKFKDHAGQDCRVIIELETEYETAKCYEPGTVGQDLIISLEVDGFDEDTVRICVTDPDHVDMSIAGV